MQIVRGLLRVLGVIGGVFLLIWTSELTKTIWSDGFASSFFAETGGMPEPHLPVSTLYLSVLILPLTPIISAVHPIMTSLGNRWFDWLSGAFAILLMIAPGMIAIEYSSLRALNGETIFWIVPFIVVFQYALLSRFKAAFFLRPTKKRLSLREQRLARVAQANQKN